MFKTISQHKCVWGVVAVLVLVLVLILAVAVILTINLTCAICHLASQEVVHLNKNIGANIVSAKEVVDIAKEEIKEVFAINNETLNVCRINMYLDTSLLGRVDIVFGGNDVAKGVYLVTLNTQNGVLYDINHFQNEPKLYSEPLDTDNWCIDSQEAVYIAEKLFEVESFQYDEVLIFPSVLLTDSREVWNIVFINNIKNVAYDARIDVYTGEVVSHGKRS